MPVPTFCIVGAGIAGGHAALELRQLGFEGRVLLLGDAAEPPYERPPLSKGYLRGRLPREKLFLGSAASLRERGIEWRPNAKVVGLDPARRQVQIADGEVLGCEQVLLATGSRPRRLRLPGAALDGVTTYRTLPDSELLKRALAGTPRVVVLGGGFLGTELAAAAREEGCPVTLVEAGPSLVSPLGELPSQRCLELHLAAGVEVRLGAQAVEFRGSSRVEAVLLEGGGVLNCDLALVCVGAEPNSELAAAVGIETDPGVVVDAACRSQGGWLLAAGDVASFWSPRYRHRLRVEHYDNALRQGAFAARALLSASARYDPIPYFWTEQYASNLQQVGVAVGGAETVVRGDPKAGSFSIFELAQGVVTRCVAVDRFPDLAAARRLIAARATVDPERLSDPTLDLRAWSREVAEAAGLEDA